jgi:predicted TIM-barrel fold metal-dependent hydrolase
MMACWWKLRIFLLVIFLSLPVAVSGDGTIPIIDAHSQIDQDIAFAEILKLMDKAGVSRTILATRRQVKPKQLLSFASRHPDRITPAVRTKGSHYLEGKPEEFGLYLDKQLRNRNFGAMAEVLMWHAEKYHHKEDKPIAPQVVFPPDSPKVRVALERTLEKGWPFIAHIEFAAIGNDRDRFMSGFETLLDEYPDHPFVLIHMGELEVEDTSRLISNYKNIYFITAMCNSIAVKNTREPLVNLFEKDRLAPSWKKLIVAHPDRFILGFDNVWARHWKKIYLPQVNLWRKALKDLPEDAAHLIAHGNAERLWNLPSAR